MKKGIWWIIVVVIIALLLIWGGSGDKDTASNTSVAGAKIKIGAMMPLSGDAAAYGEAVKKGIELARKELKADNIEVIYEDSKCSPQDAANAINKLKTDKVIAIVGEVCSSATMAAAPIANSAMIPMVAPSATSPKLTEAGDYVFRVVPSDLYQGTFGADLMAKTGHKNLAIIYSNEDYGLGLNTVITDKFTQAGGKVVASEAVNSGSTDVRTQISKIKNLKPDAIFLGTNSPDSGVAVLKQLKELGLNVPIYASESMNSQTVLDGAKNAAEGITVMSVTLGSDSFKERHEKEYGKGPDVFAAQGYDAFVAIKNAIDSGAKTGEAVKTALYKVEFDGVTGHVKFDANGDVGGEYTVFKVVGGKFVMQK